jgi:hypothetical protein
MTDHAPDRPRRDLTIIGLAPSSPETLREITRIVPADFHGTVFVVSRAGQERPSRDEPAGRRRDNSRPDAAAYAGLRLRPKRNKERNRKRA